MKTSTKFNLSFNLLMLCSFTFFLFTIDLHTIDRSNFFFPILFMSSIGLSFLEISNHFTNIRDDEDHVKKYSPVVVRRLSWTNTIISTIIMLSLILYFFTVTIHFYPAFHFWPLLNLFWIGLFMLQIYREFKLRKQLETEKNL